MVSGCRRSSDRIWRITAHCVPDDEKRLVEEVFNNAVDCLSDEDKKLPQVSGAASASHERGLEPEEEKKAIQFDGKKDNILWIKFT